MCRHGCQRLVISILVELRDLDGQSRGAPSKTARDDKRQRTAATPTRILQPEVSVGPYTTAPHASPHLPTYTARMRDIDTIVSDCD
jgi:hypothetical protein